jgi:hypothetical protein
MPNAWVTHVKKFAADNKLSYGCALSMPECKSSYKKEPTKTVPKKTKEKEEIKDTKPYTKYDKPIGPVKPKPETKPYTKYDRAIGPVKPYPLQVFKRDNDKIGEIEHAAWGKSKHKSYYKEMRKAALMQPGKEAYKKLDKFLSQNSKYDFNSGKGESYYHIVDVLPYTKYDKPIGPVKPAAYVCMYVCIHTCYVLTNPPIPCSRCKCFVFLRPV